MSNDNQAIITGRNILISVTIQNVVLSLSAFKVIKINGRR